MQFYVSILLHVLSPFFCFVFSNIWNLAYYTFLWLFLVLKLNPSKPYRPTVQGCMFLLVAFKLNSLKWFISLLSYLNYTDFNNRISAWLDLCSSNSSYSCYICNILAKEHKHGQKCYHYFFNFLCISRGLVFSISCTLFFL